MSRDLAFEPVRGLPANLPPGEKLLWQGAPDYMGMALRGFHVRKIAIYFALLAAYRLISSIYDGAGLVAAGRSTLPLIGLGCAAVAILSVMALLVCRTTVYSITSRRVVMRIGVALPITFNLPFTILGAATLKLHAGGIGTIPLVLTEGNKLSYLIMWPHVRPWRMGRTEPALRLVADAGRVARLLAEAAAASAPERIQVTIAAGAAERPNEPASWPLAPAAV